MIQQRTVLKVSDNSGAKTVRCIKVLGGFKKKIANLGDTIVVSVQKLRNNIKKNSKVKKKEVYKAVVIRTKTRLRKKDGSSVLFNENAVCLLNKKGNPLGTRLLGPVISKLKKQNKKFTSISAGLV